jgi:hypothetical protein
MAKKPKKKRQKTRRLPPIPMIEEPGKRYHLQRLNWLLGFLNADIAAMPTGDFLKLFHEFLLFFYDEAIDDKEIFRKWCVDTDVDRCQVRRAQDISQGLVSLLKIHAQEKMPTALSIDFVVCVEDEDKLVLKRDNKLQVYEDPAERFELSAGTLLKTNYPSPESEGEFSHFGDPRFRDTVRYGVLTLLTKFPLSVIQHCPNCEKFYKSSRRKESPLCRTCLTRKGVNEWRNKNRDIYNRYQASLREGKKVTIEEIRAELKQEKKTKGVNNGR